MAQPRGSHETASNQAEGVGARVVSLPPPNARHKARHFDKHASTLVIAPRRNAVPQPRWVRVRTIALRRLARWGLEPPRAGLPLGQYKLPTCRRTCFARPTDRSRPRGPARSTGIHPRSAPRAAARGSWSPHQSPSASKGCLPRGWRPIGHASDSAISPGSAPSKWKPRGCAESSCASCIASACGNGSAAAFSTSNPAIRPRSRHIGLRGRRRRC